MANVGDDMNDFLGDLSEDQINELLDEFDPEVSQVIIY